MRLHKDFIFEEGEIPMESPIDLQSKWVVKRAADRNEFRSVCGFRRNVLTPEDQTRVSISHLRINESREHYHKVMEEVYYVLKGEGAIVMDGDTIPIQEGDAVVVRPGVRHHSEGEIEVLIICVPPFEDGDVFFDES
jgi:mannose-6-phosphate isomerase-like protein (cupin superfamily)